jgi:hypothetical protein
MARLATVLAAVWLVLAGPVSQLHAGPVYRVAIFDFDKREAFPDPLARHIENRLRERFHDIQVTHCTGQGDEGRAVATLKAI